MGLSCRTMVRGLSSNDHSLLTLSSGGRQIDGCLPALMALEKITGDPRIKEAQLAGKFTVLFDSGIRRGSDIVKAVAIGAQAVLRSC